MGFDDVPRREAGRLFATIDDQLLLLDPVDQRLHVLSRTAALVYTSVDSTSSVADIASAIAVEMGLGGDELLDDDVVEALTSMHDQGLIAFSSMIMEQPGTAAPSGQGLAEDPLSTPTTASGVNEAGCVDFGPVRAGAAAVLIRIGHPEVAALVAAPLALLPAVPPGELVDAILTVLEERDGRFEVHLGDDVVSTAESSDEAAVAVLAGCNQAATTRPITAIRLHGGVVAHEGSAVVVCGESGAGKSSLVSALVKEGWDYMTDEVAVIDGESFALTPYPKWIDLEPESMARLGLDPSTGIGPIGPKCHVPPGLLGNVGTSATVTGIVLLRASDAGRPDQPRRLGPVEATTAMLGNVFATTWDHPAGMQALADLCSTATVVELPRSDLDRMVDQVQDLFA